MGNFPLALVGLLQVGPWDSSIGGGSSVGYKAGRNLFG
jgi:hypothetical protein